MRLLHVSDLHASPTSQVDQAEILGALLSDLATFHEEQPIEAIVFTGDLAYAGSAEEMLLGQEMLLAPLESKLGVGRGDIFIVPGNHDVCREDVDSYAQVGLNAGLVDDATVSKLLDNPTALARVTERLGNWDAFEASYYSGVERVKASSLGWTSVRSFGAVTVGFACLNSSWKAYGGDEDFRSVVIGGRQLTQNLSALDASLPIRVVAVHHPVDWLAAWDQGSARHHFETVPTIVLSGHRHQPEPTAEFTPRGSAIYGRCGCLYQTTTYDNSYSIVDIDCEGRTVRFTLRAWYHGRGNFDAALGIVPHGVVEYALPQPAGASLALARPYNEVMDVITGHAYDNSVIADYLPPQQLNRLSDMLVAPRFFALPYREALAAVSIEGEKPAPVEPLPLVQSGKVVVVNGDQQAGVTNSLLWVQAQAFETDPSHIPVYVPFERRFKDTRFDRSLREKASAVVSSSPGATLPPLLIAVDDVRAESPGYYDAFARYVAEHPSHRFILGTHGSDCTALTAALRGQHIDVDEVYLGPFSTRQVRDLIEKLTGGRESAILGRVFELIRLAHLPRTPFIMATLVVVLARQRQLAALNQSGLLDTYVTVLLAAEPSGALDEQAMDPKRREYFLSWFAGLLTQQGVTRVARVEAEDAFLQRFRDFGWGTASSPGSVVQNLIERRILTQDSGGVGFRLRGLQDFFAAKFMNTDKDFAEVILADAIAHEEIIRHAAGLTRTDRQLLARVGEITTAMIGASNLEATASMFNALSDRPGWSNQERQGVDRLRRQLTALAETQPPAEEEIDQRIDDMYDAMEAREATEMLPVELDEIEEMFVAVALLSSVLRSCELVDDLTLKERLLKEALHGWALTAVVWAVQEDRTHSLVDAVRKALPRVAEGEAVADRLDRLAELLTTVVLTFIMRAELGSVHMEEVIRRALDDEEFMAESVHALLATVLYVELRLPGWPQRLEKLRHDHGDHPIVAEFVRITALVAYRLDASIPDVDRNRIEALLVDIHTPTVPRGRGRGRALAQSAVRSDVVQTLRKSRLERGGSSEVGPLDELDDVEVVGEDIGPARG